LTLEVNKIDVNMMLKKPKEVVMAEKEWSDMAIELYDKLTGRGAEISYEFDNMEISIPTGTGDESNYALWKINGTLKIRTRDTAKGK
jgi:hypothetical protein